MQSGRCGTTASSVDCAAADIRDGPKRVGATTAQAVAEIDGANAAARRRGAARSVGLSFRVDRSRRVVDHSLLKSTRYADLDQLPPFPAGMIMAQIEVSVTIRFSLTR